MENCVSGSGELEKSENRSVVGAVQRFMLTYAVVQEVARVQRGSLGCLFFCT